MFEFTSFPSACDDPGLTENTQSADAAASPEGPPVEDHPVRGDTRHVPRSVFVCLLTEKS